MNHMLLSDEDNEKETKSLVRWTILYFALIIANIIGFIAIFVFWVKHADLTMMQLIIYMAKKYYVLFIADFIVYTGTCIKVGIKKQKLKL